MNKLQKQLDRMELMIKRRLPLGEEDQKLLWAEYQKQKGLAERNVRIVAARSSRDPKFGKEYPLAGGIPALASGG
jgi:hypothetical protein